jgi:hypothetical protein
VIETPSSAAMRFIVVVCMDPSKATHWIAQVP